MRRLVITGCILILHALSLYSALTASERLPKLTLAMDRDPRLVAPVVQYGLPSDWAILWRNALVAPEEDLRREAATSLMRLRQQGGANIEQMNAAMLEGFRTTTDRTAKLAIANALIQLDVREAAADLYQFAASGNILVANRIEPALAKWKFEPIQAEWLKRIQDPTGLSATQLVLSAQGVAESGNRTAVPGLLKLAADETLSTQVRMSAAIALGTLADSGLTATSRQLMSDSSQDGIVNRMVAVTMLVGHSDDPSKQLLYALAQDANPAIAAIALRRLLITDPNSLHSITDQLLKNPDANLRRLAAQSLVQSSTEKAVQTLADLLNDRHPDVRNYVRESFEVLVKQDGLRDIVLEQLQRIFAADDWRGLEQVARLFGTIDYEPAADRLVDLLKHPRTEVFVTAGWALRELAVAETLPKMSAFVLSRDGEQYSTADYVCFTYLFEAFGQAKYSDAAAIVRRFVPKGSGRPPLTRSAAIWALGYLFENNPPAELVEQFGTILGDAAKYPPSEDMEVGIAAAVSLGRMNALNPVQSAAEIHGSGDLLYEACEWAIAEITGNERPVTNPIRKTPRNPFLRPVER